MLNTDRSNFSDTFKVQEFRFATKRDFLVIKSMCLDRNRVMDVEAMSWDEIGGNFTCFQVG
eukprot:snap_masked-scaffold_13-processed-gene-3.47-mRNA-1 protein AED:1.00 eAED:1.00 QI:0/0/0/0/1/1/2/0/60